MNLSSFVAPLRRAALRPWFALVLALVLALDSPAHAQQVAPTPTASQLSKRRGDDLLEAKRFVEALAAYDEAYAADPNPALLYNRGRALQFLARYPEALASIRRFSQDASPELRARVPGLAELVADLESRVASLTIVCEVFGARILLGGRELGVCPFAAPVAVGAGLQSFEALAEGYLPFHRELTLPGAGAMTVVVALASRDTSALLVVKSKVAASRVQVDGQVVGLVPAETGLLAGEHTVQVDHEGFDPARTRIVLKAGERKELVLDPVPRPTVFARWWFWTGLAVVAAGVTTTAIVLSTESAAPAGNFSPGSVRF